MAHYNALCDLLLSIGHNDRSGPILFDGLFNLGHDFMMQGECMTTATARHILVDTEAQCLELKEKIENGEDFADVARQFSSCPSKAQGGDLGQFGPGMMVKEFDEVVFSAEVYSLQGPVKTQFGYHLLEVTSRS